MARRATRQPTAARRERGTFRRFQGLSWTIPNYADSTKRLTLRRRREIAGREAD